MKTYIITDKEEYTLMGIVQDVSRSKAVYQCWLAWQSATGLNLIEFAKIISCQRAKFLDDLDFCYFDGREFDGDYEYEMLRQEDIRREIIGVIDK